MNKNSLGQIQIFWGKGKGKTTAAYGTAFRALGQGLNVCVISFLKGSEKIFSKGEEKSAEKFKKIKIKSFPAKGWLKKKADIQTKKVCQKALKEAGRVLKSKKFNLVILDEVIYAIEFKAVSEKKLINLLANKNKETEVILTGGHKRHKALEKIAGLVTETKKIKHYYDKGIMARKGIEY